MTSAEFQHIAPTIPAQPGIYKYFDSEGRLLYVGKSKHLRKRVSSYFSKTFTSYKTHELVNRITRIEFAIVNSEQDAFLLENSLIKEFQPRFNINLKDDKTYPYIVIKNEPFPRVFLTRNVINDGSEYLGPFTSVKKVRELIEFTRQTIPLRTCTLNLTENNIKKGKFRVCLEYHLGNCLGPCEAHQSEEDYRQHLQQLKNLLKGNLSPVLKHFRDEMKKLSLDMSFEKAALIKKKIDFLENFQARSTVTNVKAGDADVFSILKEKEIAYVNFLMVRNGTIIQTQTIRVEAQLEESMEEILAFSVARLRDTFKSDAEEVVVPFHIDFPQEGVTVSVPKGGDRKKLLDLSEKNAAHFIEEIRSKERLKLNIKSKEQHDVLVHLQQDLQLSDLPVHIECFDNSNFQGKYPVSSIVVFKDAKPSKKDYRHFNVKTVEGPNDFATMEEAVHRRYRRMLEEGETLPQLIVIDGGKGQLSSAMKSLKLLGIETQVTIIGIAKRLEEIYYPNDPYPLYLDKKSESLKIIQQLRDEAHRFGITFHRLKRNKATLATELESIPGVGRTSADKLLRRFKSVKNIKTASETQLLEVLNIKQTQAVLNYFSER